MQTIKTNGRPPKVYKIAESGIIITTFTNPKLPTEEHIPFENIKNDRFYYVQKSSLLLISGGICLLIYLLILADSLKNNTNYYIINLTWALLGLIFIGLYFFLRPKVFFLKTFTGKFIKFKIAKNEVEIAAFVKNIIERRNEYLKLKYGAPNSYLSYDAQYSNFNIMVKENIITTEEYQEKIEELNSLFKQTAPQKTFLGYSQN